MTDINERALEVAANAILANIVRRKREIAGRASLEADEFDVMCAHEDARAVLSALPQPAGDEVERVARAIYESSIPKGGKNYAAWDDLDSLGYERNREECERSARAAISAMRPADGVRELVALLEDMRMLLGSMGSPADIVRVLQQDVDAALSRFKENG